RVAAVPPLDAKADDPAWRPATVVEVPLQGPGAARTLRLRGLHDGKTLVLLAEWADPTRDALYRPWIWDPARKTYQQNPQVDDGFAVVLYRGRAPADSCMLSGEEHDADSWLWRAFWSEISGLADDGRIRVSRNRIPQSNPYLATNGGQVWIREEPDDGVPGWSFFVPVEFQGPAVPSYKPFEARGSRGDVRAKGWWAAAGGSGRWTVALSRALDTGQADDVALAEGRPQAIAVAVYDKSEKGRHATSQVIWLEPRGR
ncbi:MAG: ethylbenzene dehydrogenase-related protein, partial [Deferrisomatales bacterium]